MRRDYCQFVSLSDSRCECTVCGRVVVTARPPELVAAYCRADRNEDRRERIETTGEPFPCIHRGDRRGNVKCQCGGGRESFIAAYECRSPQVRQKRCVIRVSGRLKEPEASLYAVCAGCSVREGPEKNLAAPVSF